MSARARPILRAAAIVLLVCAIVPAALAACPLCKDAKSDSDYAGGTASLPSGFYYSIILMVCAPFLLVGGLITRIALARRRSRATAAGGAERADEPLESPASLGSGA
jgi:cytochrome bd-type quinol oxidase subunit 2